MTSTASSVHYPTPSNWRKPSFDTNQQDQINDALAAIQKNAQNLGAPSPDNFPEGSIFAAHFAQLDRFADMSPQHNNTVYDVLYSNGQEKLDYANEFLDYSLSYGYAAVQAHRAYNFSGYLEIAQAAWEFGNNYTITQEQAAAKMAPSKNVTLAAECQSATLAGGTFRETDNNSLYLNMLASGYFLLVSSLLGIATGNSTYLDAASLSYQFIHTQLYSEVSGVGDGIGADTCGLDSSGSMVDAALFLEGTAVLGFATHNETLQSFMNDLTLNLIGNLGWQDPQGILHYTSQPGGAGHGRLIRALTTVYELSANNTALQDYIRAFVAVQYNALLDLASNGGDYAGSWAGPPLPYNYFNESSAADVLLGGLAMANADASSSPSTRPSATQSSQPSASSSSASSSSSNAGAIAGGIIGGILVLIMMATLAFLIIRRRRKIEPPSPAEPFDMVQGRSSVPPVSGRAAAGEQFDKPPESVPSTLSHVLPSTRPLTTASSASPPSGAAQPPNSVTQSDPRREAHRSTRIVSLMGELNELLRRGGNTAVDEPPPVYSRSAGDSEA